MEDTEARTLFSRLLEAEPPAPDIAPFITTARRDTVRRHWAFAGAGIATVAVLVAGVVAVPNLLLAGPQGSTPAGGTSVSRPPESSVQKATRLNLALKDAAKFLAGKTLQKVPWARLDTPLEFYRGKGGYLAASTVTDRAGTGELLVYVSDAKSLHGSSVAQALRDACVQIDPAITKCQQSTKPNGDRVVLLRTTKPGGQVEWTAVTARADGTWAMATSSNYPSPAGGSGQGRPGRSTPPVTVDQLSAIVLHPGLSFFATASDLPLAVKTPAPKLPEVVPSHAPSTETPAEALARLTVALKTSLPLPAGAKPVRVHDGAPPLEFYSSQAEYKAGADIVDPLGTGNLFVAVDNADGAPLGESDVCAEPNEFKVSCRVFRTKSGDQVTVYRALMPGGVTHLAVSSLRLDGTSVYLACTDYAENSVPQVKNPAPPKPQRSSTPLTEQQLIELALDPALAYYP